MRRVLSRILFGLLGLVIVLVVVYGGLTFSYKNKVVDVEVVSEISSGWELIWCIHF